MKTPDPLECAQIAFLFDVDNTLLDNDRVASDLRRHLEKEVGQEGSQRYWNIFERLRIELGYADYLGALQRYRNENPHELSLSTVSHFLIEYPFSERLFPHAIDAIERAKAVGPVAILSDGDVVFQPRKVEQSGLRDAVDGNVFIYAHKESELDDVSARFPAAHYVMVDDKLRLLDLIKKSWGPRVTTVFVRQGHYALDPHTTARYPAADVSIDCIGDLVTQELNNLLLRFENRSPTGAHNSER